MAEWGVLCTTCGCSYPDWGIPYCCPVCGGLYDYAAPFVFDSRQVDCSQPGIWRFRHSFNLPVDLKPISLGEGNTPLIWAKVFSRRVAFKCEYINPSGSFKDRGSALISAWLQYKDVAEAVEDSSGNAGASFAAYAARSGIKARIFMPSSSSGPKKRQIEAYGAELNLIPGLRSDVADLVRKIAEAGSVYASHTYLPFNLPGYATAAYEIFDQIGQLPGSVILPAGHGGLLLGLARGFDALRIGNKLDKIPLLIGVQARACAPLWARFVKNDEVSDFVSDNNTLAEGVRVSTPLRVDAITKAVSASGGTICVTEEDQIIPGRNALAALGFYVEPTSAIVWSPLAVMADKLPEPIIVMLTGSGLKYG